MVVLRLLLLLTFFTTNVSTLAFADTSENTHLYEYESGDTDTFQHYKTFLNLFELKTESFPNTYIRLKPEVTYGLDLAKVAISNLKNNEDRLHYINNGETVNLKLPSHFISFQFHSFP